MQTTQDPTARPNRAAMEAAAELKLEVVQQFPGGVVAAVHLDDEHAAPAVDMGDGSGEHGPSLVVVGVDIVDEGRHFTHTPRPPHISGTYSYQRWYWGNGTLASDGVRISLAPHFGNEVELVRYSDCDYAQLSIRLVQHASITATLTADELRAVARMCIDAAHDLDNLPAVQLALVAEMTA